MKCSLLTLSTFIDDELPPARRAEVDAHLVGCPRCSAGATTLREERVRVGRLARAHVDAESARVMLEQVGIALEPPVSSRSTGPSTAPADEPLPLQRGDATAIPFSPPRPTSTPAAIEEVTVPDVSPDLQPDLPFAGTQTAGRRPDAMRTSDAEASPEVGAGFTHPSHGLLAAAHPAMEAGLDEADRAPADAWEADLPPPLEPVDGDGDPWAAPAAAVEPALPPPLPPAPAFPATPAPPPVPTRLPAAPWRGALWSRARDSVAVRLALARGRKDLEESVEIVGGAHGRRGALRPAPAPVPAGDVVEAATATEAATASAVELSGRRGVTIAPHATAAADVVEREVDHTPPRRRATAGARRRAEELEAESQPAAEGWHAFAASSYTVDPEVTPPEPSRAPKPLGRHSRALARQNIGLVARASALLAAAGAGLRGAAATATGGARARIRSAPKLSSVGPDSRVLAGVAGIGLIFVIALLIGRASSPTHPATAARAASSAAVSAPRHSTPAQSSAPSVAASSAPSSAPSRAPAHQPAVAPAGVQTFGSGSTGFQTLGLRFGQQAAYMRVVFDLGAVSGTVSGTPRVTVAFSDARTMLVTLIGAAPAGTIATPTGTIISSITLVSGSAERTEYRFALSRPATVKAFFLGSPTRFVLDLH